MSRSRLNSLVYVVIVGFALAGCAETQLIAHTAKRITSSDPNSAVFGNYKIGNPYQIKGVWYYPREQFDYVETGIASWYGPNFHGKKTANGEIFDQNAITAAHRTLQMPSIVQVTNLQNGRSLKLRINDRGPFAHGRIIDLSRRSAQLLGFENQGTARVRVRVLGPESRALAQRLTGGTQLAEADSPIRSDVQVAKPSVSAETLAPPPGAAETQPQRQSSGTQVAVQRARVIAEPQQPDGAVSLEPVGANDVYVQAGAFTVYANALRVKATLHDVADVKITSQIVSGKEFFRVRAGPIREVSEADRVLEYILGIGYDNARIIVE